MSSVAAILIYALLVLKHQLLHAPGFRLKLLLLVLAIPFLGWLHGGTEVAVVP